MPCSTVPPDRWAVRLLEACSRQRARVVDALKQRIDSKVASSHLRLLCAAVSIYPVVTFGGSLWATQCLLHCSLYLSLSSSSRSSFRYRSRPVTCFVAMVRISSGPSVLIQGLNCHSLRIQRLRTASGPRALASSCWPLASP